MFLDGITYAAVSSMLADGIGSYDAPFYTTYLGPIFYEHLPLGLIIESWFFDVLGQHFWVERLYCLIVLGISLLGMRKLWHYLTGGGISSAWLCFLYITIPLVFWSYREHTLEVSMTAFCIWAVYGGIKAIDKTSVGWAVVCAALTMTAVWCKGPTGAFTVTAPLLYAICTRIDFKRFSIGTVPIIGFALMSIILLQVEVTRNIFTQYLEAQLLPSLAGEREITATNRLELLLDLALEIVVPLALAIIVWGISRRFSNAVQLTGLDRRKIGFLLLVGISASVPLIISLKQRRFYLLPSLPFYTMAIAYWSMPYLVATKSHITQKWRTALGLTGLAIILVSSIIMVANAGGYARNQAIIEDIIAIDLHVEDEQVISADQALCDDWAIHAYFARYARVSLQCDSVTTTHAALVDGRIILRQ
jgi:hypothetical protein